jgi:hypothetical protein
MGQGWTRPTRVVKRDWTKAGWCHTGLCRMRQDRDWNKGNGNVMVHLNDVPVVNKRGTSVQFNDMQAKQVANE